MTREELQVWCDKLGCELDTSRGIGLIVLKFAKPLERQQIRLLAELADNMMLTDRLIVIAADC